MIRCLLFLFSVSALCGQTLLPSFGSESLAGRKFSMPGAVHGHPAILIMCFTHASAPHCTDWTKRLEKDFRSNEAVEIYTVSFLEEAPRLVRGVAKTGIRSGVPKEDYDHFLIATEHEKEVKAAVHFEVPDDAYLAVLDPEGNIRWTSYGAVVSDQIIGQIRELLR